MDIKNIIIVIVIIVLLYIVIRYVFSDVNTLSNLTSGTTLQKISARSLASGSVSNSSNFTYSIWFYINDWNYKYGELKFIFARMGSSATALSSNANSVESLTNLYPCPAVTLSPVKNNINISMTCYSGDPKKPSNNIVNNSEIENVPIQRWVNLFFSVYGRTLDIYLDGKLVRTNILPGIANINQSAPTFITPMGGFYGWTSKFQYWPNASDPQQAWNVYKAGYGGNSILSSLIGQYQVKVALINNGQETSSLEI